MFIKDKILQLFTFSFNWFLNIKLAEKLIVFNTVFAFYAVIRPAAKYYIFESWFTKGNPLNVYLIGIVFLMVVSILHRAWYILAARIAINVYFIVWVFYYNFIDPFVKCEHIVLSGFYMNYIVALVYILLSIVSYLTSD